MQKYSNLGDFQYYFLNQYFYSAYYQHVAIADVYRM